MENYTGADLISEFIAENCCGTAFLVTGGACAFLVDSIGRNPKTKYVCFQHEQSAAMAADAVWRTTGKIGVTISTSGPGSTNLITGIACSWFDSIPSIHITGQVNQSESRDSLGAKVRQAGFQETDIVSMVSSITKFAKKIESIEDLVETLPRAISIALEGRMGPVLLDIPMNIQKSNVSAKQKQAAFSKQKKLKSVKQKTDSVAKSKLDMVNLLLNAKRPVVLIGAGATLSGTAKEIQDWCERFSIPYVSSWGSMPSIDRAKPNYFGSIGVYGKRKANWLIQAADQIYVFGSRLDNRQRTGNPKSFAPYAQIHVLDVDVEELKKYSKHKNYKVYNIDLRNVSSYLETVKSFKEWSRQAQKATMDVADSFEYSVKKNSLNPYNAVRIIQSKFSHSDIVISDCGANLCWVYQSYKPDGTLLFTAGGNSPMGYSLPAAIGAKLLSPKNNVHCFIGDGGLQMNIQELQTIVHYNLPIKIFILNNFGYGIIKQFQDSYFEGRHFASGDGYSVPNFAKIARAYGIPYLKVKSEKQLKRLKLRKGYCIVDIHLDPDAQIVPKTEMNHFIHDQYPYLQDESLNRLPFKYPKYPSELE